MSGLFDHLPSILLGALAGALLALAFFRGLAAELRLILGGSPGGAAMRGVALHLARFALAGFVLYGAARQGAPALLGALAGFEAARRWLLARMRRPS